MTTSVSMTSGRRGSGSGGAGGNWMKSKGCDGGGSQLTGVVGKPERRVKVGLLAVKMTLARRVSCRKRPRTGGM